MQKAVKRAEEANGRTNKIQTEEERIVQGGLPLLCLYSSEKENHKGFVPGLGDPTVTAKTQGQ